MSTARSDPTPAGREAERLPRRLVAAVIPGTLLNPLNSSMIAVALLSLRADFRVSTATATWLISGFYLAAAVGMPLMGRMADQFGPRRVFCAGLVLVGLTGACAPFAPAFGWLLLIRVVQAFGTSAAYPSGLAIFRAWDPHGRTPAAALGALSVAGSVSAALGPVLGGGLVAFAGWQAIFLVNVPVIVVGLVLALRWLPTDATPARAGERAATVTTSTPTPWTRHVSPGMILGLVDVPGVLLFSAALAGLLGFLLSLAERPLWILLPVALVAGIVLVLRERSADAPFLDVRLLAANRALSGVYLQFAAVNVVFYGVFFGLPLWLEQARGFDPGVAGLLLLPVAGIGVLSTPVAARLIARSGPRSSLIIGALMLLVGSLLLFLFNRGTSVGVLLGAGAILGIPNGFNNLGLQAALYENAPVDKTGAAGGLFQTCRYVGAILSTALLGLILGGRATSSGLHSLAAILAVISAGLLAVSIAARRKRTLTPSS